MSVRFIDRFDPPSVVVVRPSSFAAMITHCRTLRSPARYCLISRDECAVPNDAAPLRDALHGIWRERPTVTPGGVSPSELDVGWARICRAAQSNRGETLHRIR